jgi:hypothetical protein
VLEQPYHIASTAAADIGGGLTLVEMLLDEPIQTIRHSTAVTLAERKSG